MVKKSNKKGSKKFEGMTQERAVMLTFHTNGSITSFEAFTEWGITRLASIIHKLRRFNKIETTRCVKVNRFGHIVSFAKYELKKGTKK